MYTKKLIKKIEALYDVDQRSIRLYRLGKLSGLVLEKINLGHTAILKKIIAKHGFSFKNSTSEKAYASAFLITQHSDDLGFMERVRRIFSGSSGAQINKSDLGYLIDRIKVLKGLPQVYGTQYKKTRAGKITFFDIKDIKNLDKRRKKLGMETLNEYRKNLVQ
ncbi:MAG: hypothetical protein HYV67_01090 [Candidatus Taylorbacteria bacterium]|nr:hypothetical protein [Candidatus Taylorbacteria bacterium]